MESEYKAAKCFMKNKGSKCFSLNGIEKVECFKKRKEIMKFMNTYETNQKEIQRKIKLEQEDDKFINDLMDICNKKMVNTNGDISDLDAKVRVLNRKPSLFKDNNSHKYYDYEHSLTTTRNPLGGRWMDAYSDYEGLRIYCISCETVIDAYITNDKK